MGRKRFSHVYLVLTVCVLLPCCLIIFVCYGRLRRISRVVSVDAYLSCLYEHISKGGGTSAEESLRDSREACLPFEERFCKDGANLLEVAGQSESFEVLDDLP